MLHIIGNRQGPVGCYREWPVVKGSATVFQFDQFVPVCLPRGGIGVDETIGPSPFIVEYGRQNFLIDLDKTSSFTVKAQEIETECGMLACCFPFQNNLATVNKSIKMGNKDIKRDNGTGVVLVAICASFSIFSLHPNGVRQFVTQIFFPI